jgi:hypothetical protein
VHKRAKSSGKVEFTDCAMANASPSGKELDTWQEIAVNLGISVREAQYREKNEGMPVHRMPGKKPRVWARRAELDAWKAQVGVSATGTSNAVVDGADPPALPPPTDHQSVMKSHFARRALLGLAGTASFSGGFRSLTRSR